MDIREREWDIPVVRSDEYPTLAAKLKCEGIRFTDDGWIVVYNEDDAERVDELAREIEAQ